MSPILRFEPWTFQIRYIVNRPPLRLQVQFQIQYWGFFCLKALGHNLQSEAVRLFKGQERGSCCGGVGTVLASDTIDLQFESHELRNFQIKKLLVYSLKRLESRNRGREWPVKKVPRNKLAAFLRLKKSPSLAKI